MRLMDVFATMIAQASGTASPAAPGPVIKGGQLESVWDFVVKGGPTMIAIALCSLIAVAVIAERLVVLRRRRVIPPDFIAGLRGVWADRARAIEFCRANGSPTAKVLEAALRRRGERIEAVEKAVEEAGRRELVRLRHRMRLLGALPQISTMLGLLGTIFGMIKTFQAIAVSAEALGKTELLAKGIFEAWTCTAAGLLVAIPVLIAYHVLLGRIDALIVELDQMAVDWVEQERSPRPAASETAPARQAPVVQVTPSVDAAPPGVAAVGAA